tara:strand:- start:71 stop:625 length:555 start_codon:yes stop_codon:yes gene_type:complete
MKKLLASLMTASMLLPTTALASSIRPGTNVTHKTLNQRAKGPTCLVDEKWVKCDVTIDDTGVKGPTGHTTLVVQWTTEEKEFNVAGGVVGGVAGAGVGFAAGLGSCMFMGPFCLITAPAIMNTGGMVGGSVGGKGTGKYFTIVGDDAEGIRLIQEIYYSQGKEVRKVEKALLATTKLAEGELRS